MSRTILVNESRLERIITIMRWSGTRILELRVSVDIVAATTCARFSDGLPEEHDTYALSVIQNAHFGPKCESVKTHVGRSDFLFTCSLFLFFSHSVSRYGKTVKSFPCAARVGLHTAHWTLNPTSNLYMATGTRMRTMTTRTTTTTTYNTGPL